MSASLSNTPQYLPIFLFMRRPKKTRLRWMMEMQVRVLMGMTMTLLMMMIMTLLMMMTMTLLMTSICREATQTPSTPVVFPRQSRARAPATRTRPRRRTELTGSWGRGTSRRRRPSCRSTCPGARAGNTFRSR